VDPEQLEGGGAALVFALQKESPGAPVNRVLEIMALLTPHFQKSRADFHSLPLTSAGWLRWRESHHGTLSTFVAGAPMPLTVLCASKSDGSETLLLRTAENVAAAMNLLRETGFSGRLNAAVLGLLEAQKDIRQSLAETKTTDSAKTSESAEWTELPWASKEATLDEATDLTIRALDLLVNAESFLGLVSHLARIGWYINDAIDHIDSYAPRR
jgi:hypothetical protein